MAEYAKVRKVKIYLVKKIASFVHDQTIILSFNDQLGIFSINGERAYSLFVTNFGHADNSSTFVPCVKSMAAGFDSNIHNFPHGRLPFKFVRRFLVT